MMQSLGKVVVAAAGTLVTLAQNQTNQSKTRFHSLLIQALPANTGKIHIGTKGLNKSTLAGVCAILPIPTASVIASFSAAIANIPNAFKVSEIWIDADVNGEGVVASVLVD